MNRKNGKIFSILAILLVVVFLLPPPLETSASSGDGSNINRFNVVFVVDSSGSMKKSDPNKLRFEAIGQFINLLAEQGNYIGAVAYGTDIFMSSELKQVNSMADKQNILDTLKSVTGGPQGENYTNTGLGLSTAVNDLLEKGDKSLPSVIVLLSDGETEMPSKDRLEQSLDLKADAIQTARENDISIYSVCLNYNDKPEGTKEMAQISKATGGESVEVTKAEDFQSVFNTFYNLIYGTSTINLIDDVFPESGIIETSFDVPGIGVEEVNIVINGTTTSIELETPDGSEANKTEVKTSLYTLVKVKDLTPGTWKLITKGVPKDQIKVNMVFNTNLNVDLAVEPTGLLLSTDEELTVKAVLSSGATRATSDDQYKGYSAKLVVMNAYGDELFNTPMGVEGGAFKASIKLDEASYFVRVDVASQYLNKSTDSVGPVLVYKAAPPVITINEDGEEEEQQPAPPVIPVNTAPRPVEETVTMKINVWPFFKNELTIDMNSLAVDDEDETLFYRIESSSYMEDEDYVVNGNTIVITHFSLSKGSFDIKAIDKGGLSCNIQVLIIARNIGLIAAITILVGGALAAIGLGIGLYVSLQKPFMGAVEVHSDTHGVKKGKPIKKRRGRIKLSYYGLDNIGIDYNKSYIQASGKDYVTVVLSEPVTCGRETTKKIVVQSGIQKIFTKPGNNNTFITVNFTSGKKKKLGGPRRPGMGPMGGGRPGGPMGGGRPGMGPMGGNRPGAGMPGGGMRSPGAPMGPGNNTRR